MIALLAEAGLPELGGGAVVLALLLGLVQYLAKKGDAKLERLEAKVTENAQEIALLKRDSRVSERDMAELKRDVGEIKGDVGEIKGDLKGVLRVMDGETQGGHRHRRSGDPKEN